MALYRYWNPTIADHFYTTNWAELGWGNYGWQFERIQGYVWPTQQPGAVPLYRYWNAGLGDHFYTTNWAELGWGNYGWQFEQIQCYVHGQATTAQAPGAPSGAGASAEGPAGNGSVHGHEASSFEAMPGLEHLATAQQAPDEAGPPAGIEPGRGPFEGGPEPAPTSFTAAAGGSPGTSSFQTHGSPPVERVASFTPLSATEGERQGQSGPRGRGITIDVDPAHNE